MNEVQYQQPAGIIFSCQTGGADITVEFTKVTVRQKVTAIFYPPLLLYFKISDLYSRQHACL